MTHHPERIACSMLEQIARHGQVDLDITAKGDLHIDAHHTVEDIGITLGSGPVRVICISDWWCYLNHHNKLDQTRAMQGSSH